MNWFIKAFTSTLGRKLVMSLTGLFLIAFLLVHAAGNLQLFHNDEGMSFNMYTVFMTGNPIIKTISYLLYATFVVHFLQSVIITIQNRKSRPQGYVKNVANANSKWSSRNMGILGTVILVFLVTHMVNFWAQYHWSEIPKKTYYTITFDGDEIHTAMKDTVQNIYTREQSMQMQNPTYENKVTDIKVHRVKDLYKTVEIAFKDEWLVILYLFGMLALSFHLLHGFQSAWQTLGVNHRKYVPIIKTVGWLYSTIIPALFAAMPLYFYFK
ncbi:MAG: succinate dehydrogenase cytochrome b subunit [Flavobacteriaceae bacterium]|nr:succinate dehydrogenase cytochrome b subunit [Flavobacteriaceae bacterium]